MSGIRVVSSAFGALVLAGACVATPGSSSSSRFDVGPSPRAQARARAAAVHDSIVAQTVADQEGPRVSIRAEVRAVSGSRRVRAMFNVQDDAYVVVGHIDADGILRIAFPNEPGDDGFVKGQKSYQTPEFYAGFTDQYAFRARTDGMFRSTAVTHDSYDAGFGYVFIIAGWRPLHTDRFQTNGSWDTFELTDAAYYRDPRPAIYELASLLAGDNREAYTVQFAQYFDTDVAYDGYNTLGSLNGYGYCNGYQPYGFASSPFTFGLNSLYASRGYDFSYRGTNYYYDQFGDCYRTGFGSGFGYYGGYGIAQGPLPGGPAVHPRTFDLDGHRSPFTPKRPPGHLMPPAVVGSGTDAAAQTPTSPQYRQRGLLTADDPTTTPVHRAPRVDAGVPAAEHARPSLQDMVSRHAQNGNDASVGYRSRGAQVNGNDGSVRQGSAGTVRQGQYNNPGNNGSSGETRTYSRPTPSDGPRATPVRSDPSPRMSAPERASPPPPPPSPPPAQAPRVEASSRPTPPPPPIKP